MKTLFGDISALLQNNPWLAVVAVFLGGVMTASNPCVLAMIPLLMGVVAGEQGNDDHQKVTRSFPCFSSSAWP